MAKSEKLDPTPDARKDDGGSEELETIVQNLRSGDSKIVGIDLYHLLMDDAPMKLNEEQVGFVRGGGSDKGACGGCMHHYVGETAKRKVCEIFRPADDSNVEEVDVCRFVTSDGENFPLQGDTA